MIDYKHYRCLRSAREIRNHANIHTYESRYPRSQREAGLHGGEWAGKTDGSGWVSAIIWGIVGAFVLYIVLALFLGPRS